MKQTQVISFPLNDAGDLVHVETTLPVNQTTRVGNHAEPEASTAKFSEAIEQVRPAASSVLDLFKSLGSDEVALEMGLKFSAKAGVILASADSEATFKVTMKWKKEISPLQG